MSLIALISDFGEKDWFVGELKGVLYSIAPHTTIVDITHQIPPGDIRKAAFNLLASYKSFPKESIFCVAVSISTKTDCRSIVARTDNYTFIGPDNGVLSWVIPNDKHPIWCIENEFYIRKHPSSTFQARDIFGPAAAHISKGINPDILGPQITDIIRIPFPLPSVSPDKLEGEIIHIDSFGNAITNIRFSDLKTLKSPINTCNLDNRFDIPIKSQYQEVSHLERLCYVGSAGFMEIAVRDGDGASMMKIAAGQKVVIR
ncbi:MAG: SAM-dependent chlorinase/fluorinase [Fibrobacter sp.]|jgi:S-adenosylmethionine hydrolase|nr:SAM-dependent chlorinase/fluorinase [Fibrobacter sp.]